MPNLTDDILEPGNAESENPSDEASDRPGKRRNRRMLIGILAALLILVLAAAGGAF